MKILLIEDDKNVGESIKEYLELNEIECLWIEDERELDSIISFSEFDVIVLDLILRYSKGENLLKSLRLKGIQIPILIITAKTSLNDKEVCFKYGADDYLTKPFEPKELLLRIKALSKRIHLPEKITIGNVEIDIENEKVFKNGNEIKLTKTQWNLLYYLLKNRGKVVSSENILNYVWQGKVVGDEIVRAYIKDLRKIFPEGTIETLKGRGYKLN